MAKFTPQNFPYELNEEFTGAGERTCHASKDSSFVLEKDSLLVGKDVILPKGTALYFTHPERLFRGPQINAKHGIYASISLSAKDAQSDGYVMVSHVTKPAGNSNRVEQGKKTQEIVRDHITFEAGNRGLDYEVLSMAPPGSKIPDLIMRLDQEIQQFEIKGKASASAMTTVFDKSARREEYPSLLDDMTQILTQEKVSFCETIDYYRDEVCNSYGFAGDEGCGKSGKLPDNLRSINPDICAEMRDYIVDHFAEGGDNYFVVHNRSDETCSYYHTDHGSNLLGAEAFPIPEKVELRTYGGPARGATRVGVRIKI